jgi:broad specificity phosphatase PhoE
MVTTLYLIRHGETEGSGEKRYKGSIDVPLSEKGIEQVRRTAAFISATVRQCDSATDKLPNYLTTELPHFCTPGLSAVYCSPLIRALKSAEIVAELHGLKPIVIHDLRERSFGIWEGLSFTEIREKYPAEFESWAVNPLKFSPPDGESTIEVKDRVIKVLDLILNSATGRQCDSAAKTNTNIAIVAHGGVNRIILCHIMGTPLENIFRIEQDYAAVNIIEFWEKYPVVKLINGGVG